MKKLLAIILTVVACTFCLGVATSCDGTKSKIAGTYEMVSIEGTLVYEGQTTQLDKSLYEYYRIVLEKNGKARVESKAASNSTLIEADGTWEWKNKKIRLKSTQSGVSTVEEMDWADNVITYTANQSGQGMTISMTIVLEKVEQ